ncbi:hypothetical protein CRE_31013 [Caenorhabditis remanei]|uniref:Serpentine receptor class r-10 n=1 Tax=Caenorhabditis remanei TaxID=31234 RepID=E3LU44_CAERE|nr:hypothetical protein CRE_31013 [Caenorhabditis remanei]
MIISLKTLIHFIQYAGFVIAHISNSTLLVLIFKRANKLFGGYRRVMAVFAFYSLIYTWIEIITQPIIQTHETLPIVIVMLDSPLKHETWIGNEIACLYCASFALVISLLAVQFYYRYIALCKETIMNYYEEDTRNSSFIGAIYYTVEQNGEKKWRITDVMGYLGCILINISCFTTILICAFKIKCNMKNSESSLSFKTKEINRQLFVTLLFQTLLPAVMMYTPVGIVMTLPFFRIGIGKLSSLVGVLLAIYPAIEPIIAIFCIKDFRRSIMCRNGNQYIKPISFAASSTAYN